MASQYLEPPVQKRAVGDVTAMAQATNIDRHTCHRVVPMKVMCFGVSRSGTSSMRQALIDLGYFDCYHYGAIVNENPRDAEMWVEALEAKFEGKGKTFTRVEWDQLLGHCMALTDTPCAVFWKELLDIYPDTKVILTIRDSPRQWWESQMHTIIPFFEKFVLPPQTWAGSFYQKFLPDQGAFSRLSELLQKHYEMYQRLTEDLRYGTTTAMIWYEDYCDEVRRVVPEDRLLVMNVKEGWSPLCKFLDRGVPAWEFPMVNTSAEWYQNIDKGMGSMMDRVVYWNAAKWTMTWGAPLAVALFAALLYLRSR